MLTSMVTYAIVVVISCSAGVVLGAFLTGSRNGTLQDQLDSAEAANRAQAELLDELTAALRVLLDDAALAGGDKGSSEIAAARRIVAELASAPELNFSAGKSRLIR